MARNLWSRLMGRDEVSRAMTLDQYLKAVIDGRLNAGYASPLYSYTVDGRPAEQIQDLQGYVEGAFAANPIIFGLVQRRASVFSEARFCWRAIVNGNPGDVLATAEGLDLLVDPWPGATTGTLLTKMIQHADMGGMAIVGKEFENGRERLRLLRPDWCYLVLTGDPTVDAEVDFMGVVYYPGGVGNGEGRAYVPPQPDARGSGSLRDREVIVWAPIPDPLAVVRGVSWITPVLKELAADKAATTHRTTHLERGGSLGPVISAPPNISVEQFRKFIDAADSAHAGPSNAGKFVFLSAGTEIKTIASTLKDLDMKAITGAVETRMAVAAGVPATIAGISEGLGGSALNAGNYNSAKRLWIDGSLRSLWRSACDALAPLTTPPDLSAIEGVEEGTEAGLWILESDIPILAEDRQDQAKILNAQMGAINVGITAGYKPDAVVRAVRDNDLSALEGEHSGAYSVQLQPPGTQMGAAGPDGTAPAAGTEGAEAPDAEGESEYQRALEELRASAGEAQRSRIERRRPYPGQRYRHGWIPVSPLALLSPEDVDAEYGPELDRFEFNDGQCRITAREQGVTVESDRGDDIAIHITPSPGDVERWADAIESGEDYDRPRFSVLRDADGGTVRFGDYEADLDEGELAETAQALRDMSYVVDDFADVPDDEIDEEPEGDDDALLADEETQRSDSAALGRFRGDVGRARVPRDGDGDGFIDDGKPTMRPAPPKFLDPERFPAVAARLWAGESAADIADGNRRRAVVLREQAATEKVKARRAALIRLAGQQEREAKRLEAVAHLPLKPRRAAGPTPRRLPAKAAPPKPDKRTVPPAPLPKRQMTPAEQKLADDYAAGRISKEQLREALTGRRRPVGVLSPQEAAAAQVDIDRENATRAFARGLVMAGDAVAIAETGDSERLRRFLQRQNLTDLANMARMFGAHSMPKGAKADVVQALTVLVMSKDGPKGATVLPVPKPARKPAQAVPSPTARLWAQVQRFRSADARRAYLESMPGSLPDLAKAADVSLPADVRRTLAGSAPPVPGKDASDEAKAAWASYQTARDVAVAAIAAKAVGGDGDAAGGVPGRRGGPVGPAARPDVRPRSGRGAGRVAGAAERVAGKSGPAAGGVGGGVDAADLTGLPRLSTDPAVREVQVENRIREAYARSEKLPGGGVTLTDLRNELGETTSRTEIDEALRRMGRGRAASLLPNENSKALTQADRDAAVQIGPVDYHYLEIRDGGELKPLPAAATPAKKATPPTDSFERRVSAAGSGDDALAAAALRRTPTAEQVDALHRYGLESSFNINAALREGHGDLAFLRRESHRDVVDGLDSVMEPLSADIVVYRRAAGEHIFDAETLAGDLTGVEFVDDGYLSTSVTGRKVESSLVMRIVAPKGTRAVSGPWLDPDEIVLARGQRLRVVADHGKRGGTVRRIDVEIVPTRPAAAPAKATPAKRTPSLPSRPGRVSVSDSRDWTPAQHVAHAEQARQAGDNAEARLHRGLADAKNREIAESGRGVEHLRSLADRDDARRFLRSLTRAQLDDLAGRLGVGTEGSRDAVIARILAVLPGVRDRLDAESRPGSAPLPLGTVRVTPVANLDDVRPDYVPGEWQSIDPSQLIELDARQLAARLRDERDARTARLGPSPSEWTNAQIYDYALRTSTAESAMWGSADVTFVNGPYRLQSFVGTVKAADLRRIATLVDIIAERGPLDRARIAVTSTVAGDFRATGSHIPGSAGDIQLAERVFTSAFTGSDVMPSAANASMLQYTLAHEWGHALSDYEDPDDLLAMAGTPGMSTYGQANEREAFAEAWAEWFLTAGQTTNPAARAYAQRFGWR